MFKSGVLIFIFSISSLKRSNPIYFEKLTLKLF